MNNEKPLVSICFITYHHERFLEDALKGFALQRINFPIEIIIYDDFSTDTTRDLLLKFKETSPFPVTLLFPDENTLQKGLFFPVDSVIKNSFYLSRQKGIFIHQDNGFKGFCLYKFGWF